MRKMMTMYFYRDEKKQFRWRLTSKNGRIIADSGEGYLRKSSMTKMAHLITRCDLRGDMNINDDTILRR